MVLEIAIAMQQAGAEGFSNGQVPNKEHRCSSHLSSLLEALVPLELQEAQQQELQCCERYGREAVVLGAGVKPLGGHSQEFLRPRTLPVKDLVRVLLIVEEKGGAALAASAACQAISPQ